MWKRTSNRRMAPVRTKSESRELNSPPALTKVTDILQQNRSQSRCRWSGVPILIHWRAQHELFELSQEAVHVLRPTPPQEYLPLKKFLNKRRTKPRSVTSGPGKWRPHHLIKDKSSKRRQNIKSRAAKGRKNSDALAWATNSHVPKSKIFYQWYLSAFSYFSQL